MWYNEYLHILIHDQRSKDLQREVQQDRLIREAKRGKELHLRRPLISRIWATLIHRRSRPASSGAPAKNCVVNGSAGSSCSVA
jgi:hypothetical protein